MGANVRQYGREDVQYDSWYSDWSKLLAKTHTQAELERMLYGVQRKSEKVCTAHLKAIEATHSMQSNSQRRAQTGNVVAANGELKIALSGALEIYELFPEHTKDGFPLNPPAPQ